MERATLSISLTFKVVFFFFKVEIFQDRSESKFPEKHILKEVQDFPQHPDC